MKLQSRGVKENKEIGGFSSRYSGSVSLLWKNFIRATVPAGSFFFSQGSSLKELERRESFQSRGAKGIETFDEGGLLIRSTLSFAGSSVLISGNRVADFVGVKFSLKCTT